jgi:NADPH:quinone reductase-like Zn-dependent oxidoreductase
MKAVVYEEFGSPDVLHLADVDKPTLNEDEVLVRVHAASINSADWDMLRGRTGPCERRRAPSQH